MPHNIKILSLFFIIIFVVHSVYANKTDSAFIDTSIANNYIINADTLTNINKFDSAITLIEKASIIYETSSNWVNYIQCLNRIAGNFSRKGDYTEAMNYTLKALKICETYNITDSMEVSGIYHLMGIINYYKGNYPNALEYYRKKLNTLGNDEHPVNIGTYNNMAVVYRLLGDYYSAIEYINKALNLNLSQAVENKIFTANCYHNLGNIFRDLNEFEQALEYYKKALKIKIEILGEEHPTVAMTYSKIGNSYFIQKKYTKLIYYYQIALTIRLKTLGPNHPEVALSYCDMASYYSLNADYTIALEYFHKALAIYNNTFGNLHPNISGIYQSFGIIYSEQHNYETALKYYQEAIIALVENFTSQNIYVNPIIAKVYKPGKPVEIENVGSPLDLFDALILKAAALENLFYFKLKEK